MKGKIKTYLRLGILNIFRTAFYRLTLKTGLLKIFMAKGSPIQGPFFLPLPTSSKKNYFKDPLDKKLEVFGWVKLDVSEIPDWHKSLVNGEIHPMNQNHWSTIPDFLPSVGDIKAIWELSRFDWVVIFSVNYLKSGDQFWLNKLNEWLENWSLNNPVNTGPNWKCGQEASIRVMHLIVASHLLQQSKNPTSPFKLIIREHLERISPTIGYAIAQNNNHGTSEASALFIGGCLLANTEADDCEKAKKWYRQGRYWLENRSDELIENDGSFSQYSLNYHRLMLDTMTIAEMCREWFSLPLFSNTFYKKINLAIHWLRSMIMSERGDGPNIGANDGAKLIPLCNTYYRDYRPSVQLAAAVFLNKRAFDEQGTFDEACKLLEINYKGKLPRLQSQVFNYGGYVILRDKNVNMVLRYPVYSFRPSHCDAFHLDLWINGKNMLRDSGTFSYNTDEKWQQYFSSTGSHNTIQFDDRDQMSRISRFLYGDWLEVSTNAKIMYEKCNVQQFEAGYKDWLGASHCRKVELQTSKLLVTDVVSGFKKRAVLRWRLTPGDWVLTGNGVKLGDVCFNIISSTKIKRLELVRGWESRLYYQRTCLPVLEAEVECASIFTTTITWQ